MYLSPIDIVTEPITYKLDDAILSAVGKVGIHVDKDELLKALEYDRNQYSKGFIDGYNKRVSEEQEDERENLQRNEQR